MRKFNFLTYHHFLLSSLAAAASADTVIRNVLLGFFARSVFDQYSRRGVGFIIKNLVLLVLVLASLFCTLLQSSSLFLLAHITHTHSLTRQQCSDLCCVVLKLSVWLHRGLHEIAFECGVIGARGPIYWWWWNPVCRRPRRPN